MQNRSDGATTEGPKRWAGNGFGPGWLPFPWLQAWGLSTLISTELKVRDLSPLVKFADPGFLRDLTEVLLWLLTWPGPFVALLLGLLSNTYLMVWPVLQTTFLLKPFSSSFRTARSCLLATWLAFGRVYFDYSVTGMEHIPDSGPAVLAFYHGAIPIDFILLVCQILEQKNRLTRTVADRTLLWCPGLSLLGWACGAHASGREKCVQLLKKGHLLGVAPGGGREAQLGSLDYDLLWEGRTGFANVALAANAPVIPVFTENIREAFLNMDAGKPFWKWLFKLTKVPLIPLYGFFPVRLHTHVGRPIRPKPGMTAEQLREHTVLEIRSLIARHQNTPGSVCWDLWQRIAR